MKLNLRLSLKSRGFTLIELILSIAISSMIIIVIGSLFSNTINSMKINNKKISNINESYLFFEILRGEIEDADYIVENSNRNSLGFAVVKKLSENNSRYTYFTFENNTIYRNTQKSNKDYGKIIYSNGGIGKNKIISGVENLSSDFNKSLIDVRIRFNDIDIERKYAIRSLNE